MLRESPRIDSLMKRKQYSQDPLNLQHLCNELREVAN